MVDLTVTVFKIYSVVDLAVKVLKIHSVRVHRVVDLTSKVLMYSVMDLTMKVLTV